MSKLNYFSESPGRARSRGQIPYTGARGCSQPQLFVPAHRRPRPGGARAVPPRALDAAPEAAPPPLDAPLRSTKDRCGMPGSAIFHASVTAARFCIVRATTTWVFGAALLGWEVMVVTGSPLASILTFERPCLMRNEKSKKFSTVWWKLLGLTRRGSTSIVGSPPRLPCAACACAMRSRKTWPGQGGARER